jgi:hypothetical protein
MMRVLIIAAVAACFGLGAALAEQVAVPKMWTGEIGMMDVPGTLRTPSGPFRPGDVMAEVQRAPKRTARLTQDLPLGAGAYAFTVPAGTPFYAAAFVYVPAATSKPELICSQGSLH